jgi:beclin 1
VCSSFSKIAKREDASTTYELYGSNDYGLGRLFWYRRFDTALVWVLQCIAEFGAYAARKDPAFHHRYSIADDVIGGVSIRLQFNQDAKWTRALKYMLTNLKYQLACCCTHDGEKSTTDDDSNDSNQQTRQTIMNEND